MWYARENFIEFQGEGDFFEIPLLLPNWEESPCEICFIPTISEKYSGSDDWVQQYSRIKEIDFVANILTSLDSNPRPVHVRGITCSESWDMVTEYYRKQGYEDTETHSFVLPPNALFTISVSLQHLLWCEKDKTFLSQKENGVPHYALVPPLRTPADLRTLQQAARSGMILGITVACGYESYVTEIFEKQILTPFQLSQLLYFRWKQFGFRGIQKTLSLNFPDFSESI